MYDFRLTIYDWSRKAALLLAAWAAVAGMAGCSNKVLDPTQIGRFRPTPAVNVILDTLGVAEEPAVAWEMAEEPRPEDIRAVKGDYVLQPGDTVQISIFELLQEGTVLVNNYTVTETGKLSIPEIGPIQAAGLTEVQLEEEIRRIVSPAILKEPSVTVALVTSQQRTFSILGNGVPAPGRYPIPRYDYRLMDALATAGVQMQFNVGYVYVSRKEKTAEATVVERRGVGQATELETVQPGPARGQPLPVSPGGAVVAPPKRDIPEPTESAQKYESEREMLDLISPQARAAWPQSGKVTGGSTPAPQPNDSVTASMLPGGFRVLVPMKQQTTPTKKTPQLGFVQTPVEFGPAYSSSVEALSADAAPRTEWIYEGGQWKQVPAGNGPGTVAQPPAARTQAQPQPQLQPQPQTQPQTAGQPDWVLRDGKWVQAAPGQGQGAVKPPTVVGPVGPTPATPARVAMSPVAPEWDQAIQTRSIRIPADKLLAGDPRYNLVIKPGDTIHVPVDLIGEFYIMGNVNRTGVIPITGRPMTLMMAVAAAGGLNSLAIPKRVEVRRRVGTKTEEIVMVDLDRIAKGEQPDFFVKPNDLVNVGTDATARWRAVLRNAFRAAYGFGFVYDRNFADADYGKGFPHWF